MLTAAVTAYSTHCWLISLMLLCPLAQVKEMQEFRRSLPEQTRLIVCKNTLLKQAVDRAPGSGFSELSQAAKARV